MNEAKDDIQMESCVPFRRRRWALISLIGFLIGGVIWIGTRQDVQSNAERLAALVPRQVTGVEFASSSTCRECHAREHQSWDDTYHQSMTQLALPETVVAPFDNVELTARGRWYRLHREGDLFYVTMWDREWEAEQLALGIAPSSVSNPPTVTEPIVMTTGSHHMQGYWFPKGQGNELLQLPFYYHFDEQRWIPREDVFLRSPHKDENLANWSMVCIKCHSVAGIPGGDPTQSSMNSQVAEFGIACEACHGPGIEHVKIHRQVAKLGDPPPQHDPIVNPSKVSAKKQSEICGQCHSEFFPADPLAFWTAGIGYRAGGEFEKTHAVIRHEGPIYRDFKEKFENTFWNDGTCRVGGDEFNALIASPCYERGKLSCLSCHSLHESDPNDLLAADMEGNHACQQCHKEPLFNENLTEHTHHASGSTGSSCYNCHMPYTSYALMTALRSHRITSPRVEPVITGNSPNACNLCHVNQTLDWTSKQLTSWYGQPSVQLSNDEQQIAASIIWTLRGDAMQRAIAAWHLGWQPAQEASGNQWQAPFLAILLEDPYAGVRYQAIKALQTLPELKGFKADFIGSGSDLMSSQSQAITAWLKSPKNIPEEDRGRLLLGKDNILLQKKAKRLFEKRDNNYVRIPE